MEYHRNNLKRKLDELEKETERVKSDLRSFESNIETHWRSILYAFKNGETIVTAEKCQDLVNTYPDTCEESTITVDIPYRGYKRREPEPRPLNHDSVYEAISEKLPKVQECYISDMLIHHVEETYSEVQEADINYHEHTFSMTFFVYKNGSPQEKDDE
jgi:hypothetical protein